MAITFQRWMGYNGSSTGWFTSGSPSLNYNYMAYPRGGAMFPPNGSQMLIGHGHNGSDWHGLVRGYTTGGAASWSTGDMNVFAKYVITFNDHYYFTDSTWNVAKVSSMSGGTPRTSVSNPTGASTFCNWCRATDNSAWYALTGTYGNYKVGKFLPGATSGTLLCSGSATGSPRAVCADSSGNVYVLNDWVMRKFNSSGSLVATVTLAATANDGTSLSAAISDDGYYIWVAPYSGNASGKALLKFKTSDGSLADSWGTGGDVSTPTAYFNIPFTTERVGNYIYVCSNTGNFVTELYDSVIAGPVGPPPAPGNPSQTGCGTSWISMTWPTSTGATSYDLYRNGAYAYNTSGDTWTDTGLLMGATYQYYVKAKNANGDSPASGAVYMYVQTDVTSAYTHSNLTTTSVTLSLGGAVTGAVQYHAYQTAGGANTYLGSSSNLTINLSGLNPGTLYEIRIRATNSGGYYSDYGSMYSFTTLSAAAPGQPGTPMHNGAPTTTSIPIIWTASSGSPTNYKLYRTDTGLIANTGTNNYHTDTSRTAGTGYSYYVIAQNTGGDSPASGTATLHTLTDAPSISGTTIYTTSVALTLYGVTGASLYRYYTSGGAELGNSASTTLTLTGLSPGTTYSNTYARAQNSSSYLSAASPLHTFTTKPAPPTGLTQTAADVSYAFFTWNAGAGATSYKLYVNSTFVAETTELSRSYTMPAGSEASLKIVSVNSISGEAESYSAAINIYTKCDVTAAAPSLASATSHSLSVYWPSVSGADSYSVYRNGSLYADRLPLKTAGDPFVIMILSGATSYSIRISALNGGWESSLSPETLMLTKPAKMIISTLQAADVTRTSVILRWSMQNGNKPVSVTAKSSDLVTTYSSTTDINAGTTTVTGLDTATVYSIKLIGTNATGDSEPSDAMSVTLKCDIPAAPTASSITGTSCHLTWPSVANATNYAIYKDNVYQGSTANLYYDPSGLTTGTSYNFAVEAYNWITYDGSKSAATSVLTLPSAPAGLSTTPSATTMNVTWTSIAGGTPTTVVAFSDAACTTLYPSQSTNMGTKTISVTGLTPNTAYTFYVKSQNASGYSETYTSTTGTTSVGAPTGLTLNSKTSTSADLSWTAPSGGAPSYNVYGLPGSPLNTANTFIAPSNLVPATEYSVYVKAVSGTESSASNTVVFTTDNPIPATPTGLMYTGSGDTYYDLIWNSSQFATSYDLYQDDVFYMNTGATGTGIFDIAQGHKHVWKVLAKNAAGSSALSAGVPAYTLPPVPTGLGKAAPSTTSVIYASWDAVETGQDMCFEVTYGTEAFSNNGETTSKNFTGMAANTDYLVKLRVVNPAGTSSEISITITTLPLQVQNFLITETLSNAATISFAPPLGPADTLGFYVSVQQADGSWNPVGQKTSTQKLSSDMAHTFADLTPETNYLLSVYAYNSEGNSPEDTLQCTTTDINYIIGQVLLTRSNNERVTTTFTEVWGGLARTEDGENGARVIDINKGMCVVIKKKVEAPQFGIPVPSSGPVGTQVTVSGKELGYSRVTDPLMSQVFIGTTEVTDFISWADTSITFLVPVGATTGPIIVWTTGGKVTGTTFTVTT